VRRQLLLALIALLLTAGVLAPRGGEANPAPVLSARGERLHWTAAERHGVYRLLARTAGKRQISTVVGRALTPPAVPGETVTYRVKLAVARSPWSNAVSITYPPEPEPPPEPPTPEPMIVGLNAGGWGPSAWADVGGAVKAVRLESRFATDSEVGAAADAGVTVASWLVGTGGTIGAIDPATYAAEVVALFKRYGRGGTFWEGRTDLGGSAVEVLNEPDGNWFWTDPTNYAAYTRLLKAVHEAFAANFPEAIRPKVLASWGGHEIPFGPSWKALGGLAYCDGVTVHPYGGSSGETGGALGDRHAVEEAHALSGKPVYITEVGWPTAVGRPPTGDSQQWTEAQQAEIITSFVRWARSTGYVAMVDVFGYVDYGSNNWYGIERRDRTHKPAFSALAGA
jgi:hypothetical protein